MSNDENQRRSKLKKSHLIELDDKIKPYVRRKKNVREARHEFAVKFVDRLELALRDLFS